MTSHATPLSELLSLLLKEGRRRVLVMAAIFSTVALTALAVGLTMPERYDASTLIVVEGTSVIKPLMEGRAVPTGNADQAAITLQVTEGRKILRELLVFGGWVQPPPAKQPDPREEARLLARLRSHIKVDSPKPGMIRIAYSDSDPERTYKIVNKLAEIYIRESSEGQERETREAFEFIDKQVKEYGEKLAMYHQQVLARYRRQDGPATGTGTEPAPTASIASAATSAPRRPRAAPAGGTSADELSALRLEKGALEAQLARKQPLSAGESHAAEDQLRARVSQMQAEHDRLVATYTDEHPDVKRTKRELATAKEELQKAETARAARDNDTHNATQLDDELRRAARTRLDDVNKKIAAATGVPVQPFQFNPTPTKAPPVEAKIDPELRGIGQDTTLAELLRRYEATRDVYQDLLKRRESARVSMELTAQHGGTNLRVQEPAELPIVASGLRLLHFCIGGLALAGLIPLGVVFLLVRFDRRVRSAHQIEVLARVPLLVSISSAPVKAKGAARLRSHNVLALVMIASVFAIYLVAFLLHKRTTA